MKQYGHYINGREVAPAGLAYFPTENPYTGEAWASVARGDHRDVDAAVGAAKQAFESGAWSSISPTHRGALLRRLADLLAAGIRVYEMAARGLKTVTLELGGKSPNIVFDDADLDQALNGVVSGIFAAAGQSCQAGSRLLLQRSIHDEFVHRLIEFTRKIRLGDPTDPETQIGPIATQPQFEKILQYIQIAKAEGAHCAFGGRALRELGAGRFIEPTIFTGVDSRMRIAQEEVFGPVLAVIPFDDEADAIRIGNDVVYGLAAAVWTRNLHRAVLMSEKLRAGTVWVNNYRATSFTSPFGGVKRSGIGRESGMDSIREYLDTKCVWISTDVHVANPFIRR